MTLEIDHDEMLGVMMASLVRRLRDRGWAKENAERIAGKAVAKAKRAAYPLMVELQAELASAFTEGATEKTLRLLCTSAFALAGVDVADDLTRTSIAERN